MPVLMCNRRHFVLFLSGTDGTDRNFALYRITIWCRSRTTMRLLPLLINSYFTMYALLC